MKYGAVIGKRLGHGAKSVVYKLEGISSDKYLIKQ